MPNRKIEQIREIYNHYLKVKINTEEFIDEENRLILHYVKLIGTKFSLISQRYLIGRTPKQIQNQFYKLTCPKKEVNKNNSNSIPLNKELNPSSQLKIDVSSILHLNQEKELILTPFNSALTDPRVNEFEFDLSLSNSCADIFSDEQLMDHFKAFDPSPPQDRDDSSTIEHKFEF
jgi:hypothetical protein